MYHPFPNNYRPNHTTPPYAIPPAQLAAAQQLQADYISNDGQAVYKFYYGECRVFYWDGSGYGSSFPCRGLPEGVVKL